MHMCLKCLINLNILKYTGGKVLKVEYARVQRDSLSLENWMEYMKSRHLRQIRGLELKICGHPTIKQERIRSH